MSQRRRVTVAYDDVSIDVILDEPAHSRPIRWCCCRPRRAIPRISTRSPRCSPQRAFWCCVRSRSGMCGSIGPMEGLTLHDYARDVAVVIERLAGGPAFVLGHAFGQWIGRCVAADHPRLVRGMILAAAAAKAANPALREHLAKCVDTTLPDPVRLAALQVAFFAPGHDPSSWLGNWHPVASKSQRAASAATPQGDWWGAGSARCWIFRPSSTRGGQRKPATASATIWAPIA